METEAEAPARGSLPRPLLDPERAALAGGGFGEEGRLRSVLLEGRAGHPPDRPSRRSLGPPGDPR